ncbi:MAG: FmdE family protein [Actinomycetota bacterium]|nr:FmdE family protein [Actinomycetota bacterium]
MGYRDDINNLILKNDLKALLKKSAEFHGHICSFSAYGVKAGCYAIRELAQTSEGMEEVLAIVETNNCFSDGIQLVTGCTFGNNGLIFKDIGKTAVTVINRKNSRAIRLSLKAGYLDSKKDKYPEVSELFEKIVTRRKKVSNKERQKFFSLSEQIAISEMDIPEEEIFDIKKISFEPPGYAPIHESVICSICGENIMETRARIKNQKPVCMSCANYGYFYLDGYGISHREKD